MLNSSDFVLTVLQQEGILPAAEMERVSRRAAEQRISAPDAALELGLITPRQLALARAIVAECAYVDIDHYDIDLKNALLLPRSTAEKSLAFPLFHLGQSITLGMVDPLDLAAVDRVRQLLKVDLDLVLCEPEKLRTLIERAYTLSAGFAGDRTPEAQDVQIADNDEPIVAAVNQIILRGLQEGASDIHLGPDEHELHLRYRIDGVLHTRQGPPLASHPGLVQRLKVMAGLDLTVTRRPQDGKFRFTHGHLAADLRISVIPTITGENVVIRILSGGAAVADLTELGFSEPLSRRVEAMLAEPHGMILVTGPTGSGKTTSLYSFIKRLNQPDVNIVTIEDPVEIRLPLVRQVQVNAEIGLTFAGALRSILRQDPDIILLGEIRDEEAARIAVQAALTGHLVLSTMHTNDAAGAVARLRDLGTPGFAINAAVLGVLGQRLVRRVCADCAAPYRPPETLRRRFLPAGDTSAFVRGSGCARCLGAGTRGRVGIYELIQLTPAMQELIDQGGTTAAIRALALREGMKPMWQDGLDKARLGITTLEEVASVAAGSLAGDQSPMRLSA